MCGTDAEHPGTKGARALFMSTVAAVVIMVYVLYMQSGANSHISVILPIEAYTNVSTTEKNVLSQSHVILLWTGCYSHKGVWLPSPSSFQCPVSDCHITNDRRLLNSSAAVVFHLRSVKLSDLPPTRGLNQRWVLFNGEAPPHTPREVMTNFGAKINWTVSYRRDSDIHAPYGWLERRMTPAPVPLPAPGRKAVCWLVSNCKTPSRREDYVEKLKKFIPVDVYGKCGNLKCPVKDGTDCYTFLSRKYKFYLSFENSICKDYATEKLFTALKTDMVPVVMGGENYHDILPPNSYIDALAFQGPQQLAEYLRILDKNDSKYSSYLAWKRDYKVINGTFRWVCELCRKLHLNDTKIHFDLMHWWYHYAYCSPWSHVERPN